MMAILIFACWVADTGWLLDVKHTCLFVPGVLVLDKASIVWVHHIWSMLWKKAHHGGTAGTAVVPDDQWIIHGIVLRFRKEVMKLFTCVANLNMTRVHIKVCFVWPPWQCVQWFDKGRLILCSNSTCSEEKGEDCSALLKDIFHTWFKYLWIKSG